MTVTWNGTTITGPVLIFQDELVRDDRTDVLATPVDGTLICRSENQSLVGWHLANGNIVQGSTTNDHFRQRRTSSSATPSVSRLTTNRPDEALTSADHFRQRRAGFSTPPSVSRLTTNRPDEALTSAAANGLWTCRLNGGISIAVPMGIYARGGGEIN